MKTFGKIMLLLLLLAISGTASAGSLASHGPVVHHVNAGGPDACAGWGLPPGCDKNFALSAHQYADGTVQGWLTDRMGALFDVGPGSTAYKGAIDCLVVVGNEAWFSGTVTQGEIPSMGLNLVGLPFVGRIRDNGVSANQPPDQISVIRVGDLVGPPAVPCTEQPDYELLDMPQGQVQVR